MATWDDCWPTGGPKVHPWSTSESSTDSLTDLMFFAIAIMFAVAALVSNAFVMVKWQAIRRSAEDGSRQRREEGYRLDYLRPYIWMLATRPRRLLFCLLELTVAGWLLRAYWPN